MPHTLLLCSPPSPRFSDLPPSFSWQELPFIFYLVHQAKRIGTLNCKVVELFNLKTIVKYLGVEDCWNWILLRLKMITKYFLLKTNDILFQKLFWTTITKNCSSDWENCGKFNADRCEFAKCLRSPEQFIWTVKVPNNFWNRIYF